MSSDSPRDPQRQRDTLAEPDSGSEGGMDTEEEEEAKTRRLADWGPRAVKGWGDTDSHRGRGLLGPPVTGERRGESHIEVGRGRQGRWRHLGRSRGTPRPREGHSMATGTGRDTPRNRSQEPWDRDRNPGPLGQGQSAGRHSDPGPERSQDLKSRRVRRQASPFTTGPPALNTKFVQ